MLPHSSKKAEILPTTALAFAADVEGALTEDIWDLRKYKNRCNGAHRKVAQENMSWWADVAGLSLKYKLVGKMKEAVWSDG